MLRKALLTSQETLMTRIRLVKITAENADSAVSSHKQLIHRTACRCNIVRGNAGKILKMHLIGTVRHQHTRHIHTGELPVKIFRITAEEQKPKRLSLPAKKNCLLYLICILVQIRHDQRIFRFLDHALDFLHDTGKKHI